MRTLRSAISEFLQLHNLQDQKELIHALQYRFSLEYIPGASQLNLTRFYHFPSPPSSTLPQQQQQAGVTAGGGGGGVNTSSSNLSLPSPPSLSVPDGVLEGLGSAALALPSPGRPAGQQQPLSVVFTSSSTDLLHTTGGGGHQQLPLYPTPAPPTPLSSSSSSLPTTTTTTGRLYEKTLAGKSYMMCSLRRTQHALWTTYRLFLDGTKDFDEKGDLCNTVFFSEPRFMLGTRTLKSGISSSCLIWKTQESRHWKDKNAIGRIQRVNNYYLTLPITQQQQQQQQQNEINNNKEVMVEGGGGGGNGNGNNEERSSGSNQVDSLPEVYYLGAPIGVSVERRGMEKLLHLTVAFQKAPIPSTQSTGGSGGSSSSGGAVSTSTNEVSLGDPSTTTTELLLLPSVLENMVRNPDPVILAKHHLCVLRSQWPRKGSTNVTVAFGKESRVKEASRKNVALDVVYSADGSLSQDNDWSSTANRLPVLQMGKMAEDHFAVDFYGMSPFQAFAIAMSAFDR
eukprot:gene2063-2251_t